MLQNPEHLMRQEQDYVRDTWTGREAPIPTGLDSIPSPMHLSPGVPAVISIDHLYSNGFPFIRRRSRGLLGYSLGAVPFSTRHPLLV
jgi:hypothetical protein